MIKKIIIWAAVLAVLGALMIAKLGHKKPFAEAVADPVVE